MSDFFSARMLHVDWICFPFVALTSFPHPGLRHSGRQQSEARVCLHRQSFVFRCVFTVALLRCSPVSLSGEMRVQLLNQTLLDLGLYDDGPYEVADQKQLNAQLIPVPYHSYLGRICPRRSLLLVHRRGREGREGTTLRGSKAAPTTRQINQDWPQKPSQAKKKSLTGNFPWIISSTVGGGWWELVQSCSLWRWSLKWQHVDREVRGLQFEPQTSSLWQVPPHPPRLGLQETTTTQGWGVPQRENNSQSFTACLTCTPPLPLSLSSHAPPPPLTISPPPSPSLLTRPPPHSVSLSTCPLLGHHRALVHG